MYTTTAKDTSDSIALAKSISSAALYLGNTIIGDYNSIDQGTKLCLPLAYASTWIVKTASNATFGHVICLTPQNGKYKMADDAYQGFDHSQDEQCLRQLHDSDHRWSQAYQGTTIHCGI
ncbi:hypothetical protein EDB81DRAFT_750807 [Dactylonectria macrodidyma]|uniref:Uncharacterized protein n=1 Tax=Dactylonectria macrodidyma TaxID=307937 RepID=A0A9P9FTS6_9HYPO|nr:hypothetical protein EDB81DRAFT_750807 [Dactylonectria macrodidyma]